MNQINWSHQTIFLLGLFSFIGLMLFLSVKLSKKDEFIDEDEDFRLPRTGECIEILEDYREEGYNDGRISLMLHAGEFYTVKNYVGIGDGIETSWGIVSLTALRFCRYRVWDEC
jgi:hypothetical protein